MSPNSNRQVLEHNFKYRSELQDLIDKGAQMPQLHIPTSKTAYRYVFSDKSGKNHIPVYIQKPQRIISDADRNRLTTSGYALSCFEDEDKAVAMYNEYKAHSPQIKKTLGDSLSCGTINESDGLITIANQKSTHFDLYEFSACNLSRTFQINRTLI